MGINTALIFMVSVILFGGESDKALTVDIDAKGVITSYHYIDS